MLRATLSAFLAALSTGACATLVTPHGATLHIRSDPPGATVLDSAGKALGTTPLRTVLRTREQQRFTLFAPGTDTVVVTVGRRVKEVLLSLLNPVAWVVDGPSGAFWEHHPSRLSVTLQPSARLDGPAMAAVLTAFADAAEAAGCDTLLLGAWRDAALELAGPLPSAVPDSIRRFAAEEVAGARPELRALCAERTPRLERLREIGQLLRAGAPPASAPDAPLLAPVYFEVGRWTVRDDSVRERLRALGRRLAGAGLPVRLVVEGCTDPTGTEALNRELGYARANGVIRELQRGGLPRDCCVAASHPAAPGPSGPDAHLERRVTFSLDYREAP